MIHYRGKLSKRPERQACRQIGAQALTPDWHATDCMACKMTLLGMPVRNVADSTIVAMISDLDAETVELIAPSGDPDELGNTDRVSYEGFQNAWEALR